MALWTVVRKSSLDEKMRSDPEYFSSKYNGILSTIKKHKMKRIGDKEIATQVTDGDHGNPEFSVEKGTAYYIKSKELTSFGIDFERAEKVTEEYATNLGDRCTLHKGEVLLSTVGTVGVPCIAIGDFPKAVLSRDIAKIVPNTSNILPEYLYLYLATDFCQSQIEREVSGSVQGGLYLHALKKIAINKTSMGFQLEIKKIVKKWLN